MSNLNVCSISYLTAFRGGGRDLAYRDGRSHTPLYRYVIKAEHKVINLQLRDSDGLLSFLRWRVNSIALCLFPLTFS